MNTIRDIRTLTGAAAATLRLTARNAKRSHDKPNSFHILHLVTYSIKPIIRYIISFRRLNNTGSNHTKKNNMPSRWSTLVNLVCDALGRSIALYAVDINTRTSNNICEREKIVLEFQSFLNTRGFITHWCGPSSSKKV